MRDDILKAISKEKNINSIIVLTHNIDFIFIQTVVLKFLKKIGNPSLTIFADAQCVQESYENQKLVISGLGKRYRVVPISLDRSYDRFHPKAVLLSGSDKASLFVGSGNLTFGGWRQNAEIWNRYRTQEDGTAIFNAFKHYLDGIVERLPYTNNITKSISNAYNKETAPWSSNMESSAGLIGRINTNVSLLEQMKEYVDVGCKKLVIQSPYFDTQGKTIKQLNDLFIPKSIEILAQHNHSDLTQEIIDTLADNIFVTPSNFTHYTLDKAKQAFIHAKFYAFIYDEKVIIVSGSANCSQAAMTMNKTILGNAELMNVKEISVEEFNMQYYNEIEKVEKFEPKKQIDVEESYEEINIHKAVVINSAQFEYKHIKVSIKLHKDYEITGCKIANKIYPVKFIDDNSLLYIEGFEDEPHRLCLIIKNIKTNELSYSDEIWIDHEKELSTSSKTRSLSDFIQGNSNLSWSHTAFEDLLKIFNEHLTYSHSKMDSYVPLGGQKTKSKTRTVFNPSDVFIDNYNFTSIHSESSNRYAFDINSILRQYLGLYNQLNESEDENVTALTQEELEEQFQKDALKIDTHITDEPQENNSQIDEKDKRKIQKLIETLVSAFTNKEIVTNRPLTLLIDDLKVASIVLRLGLNKGWISAEEYFDTTYILWTEFFFSSQIDEDRGYVELKIEQEGIDTADLHFDELSASMLTWLCAIEPSNELKYIRLMMSAILVQAKYKWIFYGAEYKLINVEVNKALVAFRPHNIENTLTKHADLWKLIVNTGNAFAELMNILDHHKIVDYKDKIPLTEVPKGELLWQGNENFYIVSSKYTRKINRQNKYRAEVMPLNQLKTLTSFVSDCTIPIHELLKLSDFSNLKYKKGLLNFMDKYLLKNVVLTNL